MVDGTGADETGEGFSAEQLAEMQLIMTMRLYDAVMALVQHTNPDAAQNLIDIHGTGAIAGFTPQLSGIFVADKMNDPNGEGYFESVDESGGLDGSESLDESDENPDET